VAQSNSEAIEWWLLVAEQGNASALYYLGACYAIGEGLPVDLDEALRLYKRAAAKGHAEAAAEAKQLGAFLKEFRGR